MKQARVTLITLAGIFAASLITSTSAIAGERVDWSVTVGSGGYPPPVVYSPPPRVVYAPPPVVYSTPAPVVHYGGYYGPPRHAHGPRWHGHHRRHHHGGHRHHGHDRHEHGRHGHRGH